MINFKTTTEMDAFADLKVAETLDEKYSELEKGLFRLGLTAGYLQAMKDAARYRDMEEQQSCREQEDRFDNDNEDARRDQDNWDRERETGKYDYRND